MCLSVCLCLCLFSCPSLLTSYGRILDYAGAPDFPFLLLHRSLHLCLFSHSVQIYWVAVSQPNLISFRQISFHLNLFDFVRFVRCCGTMRLTAFFLLSFCLKGSSCLKERCSKTLTTGAVRRFQYDTVQHSAMQCNVDITSKLTLLCSTIRYDMI